jgi:hypothetical protein
MTQPADPSPASATLPATTESAPAASPAVSAKPDSEPGRSFIDRLLGRTRDPGPPAASPAEPEEPTASEPDPSAPRSYTQDELARLVQAEADRRDAKRLREHQDAERRRLRREDPFAYAEQDEQHEQQQQSAQQFGNQIATIAGSIDRAVLDPLLERVPDKVRAKLFEDPTMGVGLEGRKALVTKALSELERDWKAQGRAEASEKLLDDPIHQKKVLARVRGEPDYEEPENVPGTPARTSSRDVNAILRQSLGY